MVLSLLVDNNPGVLARVASLFSRRGYNIDSLTAGVTNNPKYTRITVAVSGDDQILQQIRNQIAKLEEVRKIIILDDKESVCRELGVSAAYFSTVFKKETGKTFISFLTDYRMEKAVELLMTTNDKTYIITEKVGYADPNYFSYAFKKQYSMSPSKYRTANS